jgi:hypothetical protein
MISIGTKIKTSPKEVFAGINKNNKTNSYFIYLISFIFLNIFFNS